MEDNICRYCLGPEHPSGTICRQHPDLIPDVIPPGDGITCSQCGKPDNQHTFRQAYECVLKELGGTEGKPE